MDRYLNTKQAAGILGVLPKQVREYITSGKLRAYKLGSNSNNKRKHWRIKESELIRFVEGGNTHSEVGTGLESTPSQRRNESSRVQ